MAVTATSSDRNYLDLINGTASTSKKYNAKFDNSDKDLSVQDFFNMMVTQLTNQDFMNPVDDTQYLAQMAQFATMQEMMDLCSYSKQNYVMDMLGKEVTLESHEIGGESKLITGKVDKIGIENNEYKVYIDGTPYDYSKVKSINGEAVNKSVTDNSDTVAEAVNTVLEQAAETVSSDDTISTADLSDAVSRALAEAKMQEAEALGL